MNYDVCSRIDQSFYQKEQLDRFVFSFLFFTNIFSCDLKMRSANRHRKQRPLSNNSTCQKRARSRSITEKINEKFKEIEQTDSTGILQYMDDQVHDTWDNAKAAMVGAQRLLQFHELPKEWQENEYVLTGYVR